MTSDVLLRKLQLPPSADWTMSLVPAPHSQVRSSTGSVCQTAQGYVPLYRYTLAESPVTAEVARTVQDVVAAAGNRPVLVQNPLDYKAEASPRYTPFGSYTMGAFKFLGARYFNGPSLIKIYALEGAMHAPTTNGTTGYAENPRRRLLFKPIFYAENGAVTLDGVDYPFTLDAITREILVDGQAMLPPTVGLTAQNFGSGDGVRYPQQGSANIITRASFDFWTPMVITGFQMKPIAGNSQQRILAANSSQKCFAYRLAMTLTETIPQSDSILIFDSDEVIESS